MAGSFEIPSTTNGFVYPISNSSSSNAKSGSSSISNDGDLLYEETRKGQRESATIIEFMRKRVKIEEEYARALLQLCKSFPLGSKYETLLYFELLVFRFRTSS